MPWVQIHKHCIPDVSVPYPACPKSSIIPSSNSPLYHRGCKMLFEVPYTCPSLLSWNDHTQLGNFPLAPPHKTVCERLNYLYGVLRKE